MKILSVQIRRASISCPKCNLFSRFRGIKNEGNKAVLIQKGNCMVKRRKLTRCIEERKVGLSKIHFRHRNFDTSINCKLKVIFSQNCLFYLCMQMFLTIYPNLAVPQSTLMSVVRLQNRVTLQQRHLPRVWWHLVQRRQAGENHFVWNLKIPQLVGRDFSWINIQWNSNPVLMVSL